MLYTNYPQKIDLCTIDSIKPTLLISILLLLYFQDYIIALSDMVKPIHFPVAIGLIEAYWCRCQVLWDPRRNKITAFFFARARHCVNLAFWEQTVQKLISRFQIFFFVKIGGTPIKLKNTVSQLYL